jgi:hypothetical protein
MSFSKNILNRVILIIILVVLLAGMQFQSASAALRTCRTDPIVFLSDGHKVSLSATMATDAANVSQIKYTLHVPSGVRVTGMVFTGGDFARKEMVMVWADLPPGLYKSETVVHTHQGIVDVSATTMLLVGVSDTAYGRSGDSLRIELSDPGTAPRSDRGRTKP